VSEGGAAIVSVDSPPPFVAKETEMMVLAACLDHAGVTRQFVEDGLREAHFFSAHHRTVWRRLMEAWRETDEAPQLLVRMLLAKHGELEEVGNAYLATLLGQYMPRPRRDAVRALTSRLIECAVGRDALVLLRKQLAALEERPAGLADGFFSDIEKSLRSLSSRLKGHLLPDHVSHISDVMAEVKAALLAGQPDFIDTPWPALNNMLGGGIAPGELLFLGARPGLGKTAAALEIARRAGKRGKTVFCVSREMLKVALGMRMLAQEGPVNATYLRKRDLLPSHWRTVDLAIEELNKLPVFLTHAKIDIEDIERLVRTFKDEGGIDLLIVDYLQLIDPPGAMRSRERRLQVEAVSAGLKGITLDHGVPVLCLSSLARPADGKAPTLASLRESGNLEHDADSVLLLHRQEEMDPQTQCIVAKSRNGRTGMVELFFRGEYLRFEEQTMTGVA
jgi:replicative DNA helicase